MTRYFSDTCNVLTNIGKVQEYPFPHVGTFECLPPDIYDLLVQKRPPWQAIAQGEVEQNNKRVDLPARGLLESNALHSVWKDFVSYHTSQGFYHKILDHFEVYFEEFYNLKNMRDYKVAVRYTQEPADIVLECQLSVNTPVKVKSTVNHPHVDNPLELFASLLYMKEPEDNAGGNLVLYKTIKPVTFHEKREAGLDCIRPVKNIPYSPNTYVGFINSPISVHGVTEREVTERPRLMVNISVEMIKDRLFNV